MNESFLSLREICALCHRHADHLPRSVVAAVESAAEPKDEVDVILATFGWLRTALYSGAPASVLEPLVLIAATLDMRQAETIGSVVQPTFRALLGALLLGVSLDALVSALSLADLARVVAGLLREQRLDDAEKSLVVRVVKALEHKDGAGAAVAALEAASFVTRPAKKDDRDVDPFEDALFVVVLGAIVRRFVVSLH